MLLNIVYTVLILATISVAMRLHANNKAKIVSLLMVFNFVFLILLAYHIIFKTTIFAIFLICYGILIYYIGRKNYYDLEVKNLEFTSSKIDNEFNILYVADFQHDLDFNNYNYKMAKKVLDSINKQNYDLLLFGGDYINYISHIDQFSALLSEINNRKQAYGVYGNHDFEFINELENVFKQHNIQILKNELIDIVVNNNKIKISGVEDVWTGNPSFEKISPKLQSDTLHINLTHNPDFIKDVTNSEIDLSLAGHYHAGQVSFIPKLPIQRVISKYIYGLFEFNKIKLYVTSGAGGSFGRGRRGSYLRFNTKAEIVKIKFKPSK